MLNIKKEIHNRIWRREETDRYRWQSFVTRLLKVSYVVARDLADGQLTLRATSLVYTTLLSIVPLLAVVFSVLQWFGFHNQLEPVMDNFLAPLGEQGEEISQQVISFVENVNVAILGSMGFLFLIYTVLSLLQKIEDSFNFTWRVKQSRRLSKRLSDYISVIIVGPVLLFSALGITATLSSTELVQKVGEYHAIGGIFDSMGALLPYTLIILAFTFFYIFIPNTKIKFRHAFGGAIIAGTLWETSGWLFTLFIVSSTKYTTIYSAFAGLALFLIWLYISWLILLVGANIAFYFQHPEYLNIKSHNLDLSNKDKKRIALQLMSAIGQNYYYGRSPWSKEELAFHLHIPIVVINELVELLERSDILVQSGYEPPRFLPSRPLEILPLKDVLDAIDENKNSGIDLPNNPGLGTVNQIIEHLDHAVYTAIEGYTLKDLALTQSELLLTEDITDVNEEDLHSETNKTSEESA